jgi:hypothetical protein
MKRLLPWLLILWLPLVGCSPASSHYYKPAASIGKAVPMMVNYQTGPREGLFIVRPWGEVYVSLVRDASKLKVTLYSQEGEPSLTGPTLEIDIGDGKKMPLPVTMPEVLTNYFRGRHWGRGWTYSLYQLPLPSISANSHPEKLTLSPFEVQFKEDRFMTSEIVFKRSFSTYLLPINY